MRCARQHIAQCRDRRPRRSCADTPNRSVICVILRDEVTKNLLRIRFAIPEGFFAIAQNDTDWKRKCFCRDRRPRRSCADTRNRPVIRVILRNAVTKDLLRIRFVIPERFFAIAKNDTKGSAERMKKGRMGRPSSAPSDEGAVKLPISGNLTGERICTTCFSPSVFA